MQYKGLTQLASFFSCITMRNAYKRIEMNKNRKPTDARKIVVDLPSDLNNLIRLVANDSHLSISSVMRLCVRYGIPQVMTKLGVSK